MATRAKRKKVIRSDFIPSGITPFDTGKVKMGIYYQKPKYIEQDVDMLEVQKWIIGDPDRLRLEYWTDIALKFATGFVVLVIVLMYVRN